MKRATRSAAALMSTTALAGAGIAAAVTGVSGSPTPATPSSSTSSASTAEPALSAAVQELLNRSAALHDRLDTAHRQLRVLDRRLRQERRLTERQARHPAATSTRTTAGPQGRVPAATVPGVHASTRASGAGTTPGVHTTTRASGGGTPSLHATTRASGGGAPAVHTSTRASAAHGDDHETERKHDD